SGSATPAHVSGDFYFPPLAPTATLPPPPATITSAPPARIRSALSAIACNPEEQNRLIVIADVSTGSPARSAAIRATFIPCSPSGIAQPRITSSISFASSPGTRAIASLIANAAKSSGRVARNDPLYALPTGVLTALTIHASLIGPSLLSNGKCSSCRG